jgi:hypothetical protein
MGNAIARSSDAGRKVPQVDTAVDAAEKEYSIRGPLR